MIKRTYINGRDKKLLRKLLQKELKIIKTIIEIDNELYGWHWSSQRHALIKRGNILNELYDRLS